MWLRDDRAEYPSPLFFPKLFKKLDLSLKYCAQMTSSKNVDSIGLRGNSRGKRESPELCECGAFLFFVSISNCFSSLSLLDTFDAGEWATDKWFRLKGLDGLGA
jgi:hypothetical protein